MTTDSSAHAYRPDIDGLRAIAVLAVIAFHTFPNCLTGGFLGVDIFFVISGYLITSILFQQSRADTFTFFGFYARRVNRIFPALLLVLATCLCLGYAVLLSKEFSQLGKHVAASDLFISNFVLWDEVDYFDGDAASKPLLHLWSLAIEEQYYLVWPVVIWLCFKIGNLRRFLLATAGALLALSFTANVFLSSHFPAAAFYLPPARVWELLTGSVLAIMRLQASRPLLSGANGAFLLPNVLSIVGAIAMGTGLIFGSDQDDIPGLIAVLPVAGAALLIAAGPNTTIGRIVLSNRVVVFVGLISYPLYLWHWPLLSFAAILYEGTPPPLAIIAMVALSFVLAYLTLILLERKIRGGGASFRKFAVLLGLGGLVGALGLGIFLSGGMPSRQHVRPYEKKDRFAFTSHALGRNPHAKVMLLGDSHGAHLGPGLKKVFGDQIADYTGSGCIPFYNVDRYDRRGKPGRCVGAMNRALDNVVSSKAISGVILASMGPAYLTGEPFNDTARVRLTGQRVVMTSNPAMTDPWEIYRTGMTETLRKLTSAHKKVLFVIDIPELGFSPKKCRKTRPFSMVDPSKSKCALTRAKYEERAGQYKQLVRDVLKDFPQVALYDPTTDFCDKKWCRAQIEGRIVYRDVDHLTDEGSEYLVLKMKTAIEQLQ